MTVLILKVNKGGYSDFRRKGKQDDKKYEKVR